MKEKVFCVRMEETRLKRFKKFSMKYGTPSNVARELFDALVEGRLTIAPPTKPCKTVHDLWSKV